MGGQLRWTDPVGKPQAGRHTTAAVYLLNVGFERLSALFIETRFLRTNRRCRGRAGDTTRGKKLEGEAVDQPVSQALPLCSSSA